ncbi:MAG: hypothetical protein KTR31_37440 [Myxococcales bacterium]|nr:hypothetical protein [Myxococcales bacterium]
MLIGLVVACAPPDDPSPLDTATVLTAADLDAASGFVLLEGLVVSSPRTADDRAFFAQGADRGVRIVLGDILDDLPPPVGTPILIRGTALSNTALLLHSEDDLRALGPAEPLLPTPFAEDLLPFVLTSLPDVTVTSALDPAGHADLDALADLGGLFGVGPGYGRTGDLTGILDGTRISPRSVADWTGSIDPLPPVEATVATLKGVPSGTPVQLTEVTQATPFDRSGRTAVVQDADGRGVWIDTEAWAAAATSDSGSRGSWLGEIRHRDGGSVLRVWTPPTVDSTGHAPVFSDEDTDGALVRRTVSGLGSPDATGQVPTAEGPQLDPVFLDLGDLPDPVSITAAVRGSIPVRYGVLGIER